VKTAKLSQLRWQSQGEFQIATDDTCLYLRESGGAILAGVAMVALIVPTAGYLGFTVLRNPYS
jgi:hypothetical protein